MRRLLICLIVLCVSGPVAADEKVKSLCGIDLRKYTDGPKLVLALVDCANALAVQKPDPVNFVRPERYGPGWASYSTAYRNFEYGKGADGIVRLRGMMEGCPSRDDAVFVLPEGYRPKFRSIFATIGGAGDAYARVDIERDGKVYFWRSGNGWCNQGNPNRQWLTLDGITFEGEQ